MVCHAVLCFRRTGGAGGFSKYFPTPPPPPPPPSGRPLSPAVLHWNTIQWPTRSGTDVNTQISVCLASLQTFRPIHCKITLKYTTVQINNQMKRFRGRFLPYWWNCCKIYEESLIYFFFFFLRNGQTSKSLQGAGSEICKAMSVSRRAVAF